MPHLCCAPSFCPCSLHFRHTGMGHDFSVEGRACLATMRSLLLRLHQHQHQQQPACCCCLVPSLPLLCSAEHLCGWAHHCSFQPVESFQAESVKSWAMAVCRVEPHIVAGLELLASRSAQSVRLLTARNLLAVAQQLTPLLCAKHLTRYVLQGDNSLLYCTESVP